MFIVREYSICVLVVVSGTILLFTASVTFFGLVEGVRILAKTFRRSAQGATRHHRDRMRTDFSKS